MRFVNKKELSEILKISIGKIDLMIKNGEIKYYKIGKSVRFKLDEIVKDIKLKFEVFHLTLSYLQIS